MAKKLQQSCRNARHDLEQQPPAGWSHATRVHLEACSSCAALAKRFDRLVATLRALGALPQAPEQLARIYRGVQRETDRRAGPHRFGRYALVGALVLGVCLAAVWYWSQRERPPGRDAPQLSLAVSGQVTLRRGERASARQHLREGDVLETSTGAAEVTAERIWLRTLQRSRLRVLRARQEDFELALEQGTVLGRVAAGAASRFHIVTQQTRIEVAGATFSVHADVDVTEVALLGGQIRMRARGRWLKLPAPANLRVERGRLTQSELAQQERAALERAFDAPLARPRAERFAPPRPPRRVAGPDHRPVVPEPGAVPDATPAREGKDAPRPRKQAVQRGRASRLSDDADETKGGACVARPRELLERLSRGDGGAADEALKGADCYEAAGHVRSALELVEEVVRHAPAGEAQQMAAYERARLLRRMNRQRDALSAFSAYVARYPASELAPEAVFRVCLLERQQKRFSRAAACLARLRGRYPASARVPESFLLQAEIFRADLDDCRKALPLYNAYLRAPGDDYQAARRWRDWCLARIRRAGAP